jgi:hypothetical protein
MSSTIQNSWAIELLDAFRSHYHQFAASVQEAVINSADSTVLCHLGDDPTEYANLVHEVSISSFVLSIMQTREGLVLPDF